MKISLNKKQKAKPGDNVLVVNKNSIYKGQIGSVIMPMGEDYLIKLENDIKNIIVNSAGIKVVDKTLFNTGGIIVSDSFVDSVLDWVGEGYKDYHVYSVIEGLEGLDTVEELKVKGVFKNPDDYSNKVYEKVDELYSEIMPGNWHADLNESDVKDILWGIVMAAKDHSFRLGGGINGYKIYHETLSSALQEATNYAEKQGYGVTGNYFPDITIGGVGYGQYAKTALEVTKNNRILNNKLLQIAIYRMDSGRYELTCGVYEQGGMMATGGGVTYMGNKGDMVVIQKRYEGEFALYYLIKAKSPNDEIDVVFDTEKDARDYAESSGLIIVEKFYELGGEVTETFEFKTKPTKESLKSVIDILNKNNVDFDFDSKNNYLDFDKSDLQGEEKVYVEQILNGKKTNLKISQTINKSSSGKIHKTIYVKDIPVLNTKSWGDIKGGNEKKWYSSKWDREGLKKFFGENDTSELFIDYSPNLSKKDNGSEINIQGVANLFLLGEKMFDPKKLELENQKKLHSEISNKLLECKMELQKGNNALREQYSNKIATMSNNIDGLKQEYDKTKSNKVYENLSKMMEDYNKLYSEFLHKTSILNEEHKEKLMSLNSQLNECENKIKGLDSSIMKEGGNIGEQNREMVLNNANQIKHHAKEFEQAAKNAEEIPAWVVAKVYRSSSDLSDVTHYLDGTTKMAKGGGVGKINVDDLKRAEKLLGAKKVREINAMSMNELEDELLYAKNTLEMIEESGSFQYDRQSFLDAIKTVVSAKLNKMARGGGVNEEEIQLKKMIESQKKYINEFHLNDEEVPYVETRKLIDLEKELEGLKKYANGGGVGNKIKHKPIYKLNLKKGDEVIEIFSITQDYPDFIGVYLKEYIVSASGKRQTYMITKGDKQNSKHRFLDADLLPPNLKEAIEYAPIYIGDVIKERIKENKYNIKEQGDKYGFYMKNIENLKNKKIKLFVNGEEHSEIIIDRNKYANGGEIGQTCEIFNDKGERQIDEESIRKVTACVENLTQTKQMHSTNGEYTPERKELHNKIITKFKKGVTCITKGKPIAVLMGGSPASGKSTFLTKYKPYLLSKNVFKVDADEIRAELPEYKGWNASQTHEETSDIVNTLISDRNIGVPCKFDFIFDGTMSSVKKYIKLINLLKSEGYEVFIVFLTGIPKEEIVRRAMERYKKMGRFVPTSVIDDFFKNAEKNLQELKGMVDGYLVIDAATPDNSIIDMGGKNLPNERIYEQLGSEVVMKKGGNVDKPGLFYVNDYNGVIINEDKNDRTYIPQILNHLFKDKFNLYNTYDLTSLIPKIKKIIKENKGSKDNDTISEVEESEIVLEFIEKYSKTKPKQKDKDKTGDTYLYYKELVSKGEKAYKNATGGEAELIMQDLQYNRRMMNRAKNELKKKGLPIPKMKEGGEVENKEKHWYKNKEEWNKKRNELEVSDDDTNWSKDEDDNVIAKWYQEREEGWVKYKKGGVTPAKQKKIAKVMREFKEGELHIGQSDKIVKDPKQAIAIALSEAGVSKKAEGDNLKGWSHKK